MLPLHTILVATDFSAPARRAAEVARALARTYGARLVAVHVVTPPAGISYGEIGRALGRPGYRRRLQARLSRISPDWLLPVGEPAAEILAGAAATACDLIVLGTTGRSGLARAFAGSVAESVLRRARCPVLTVPPARPNVPRPRANSRSEHLRSRSPVPAPAGGAAADAGRDVSAAL